ncbi:conserved hypothetical protein [Neospora caninum Liverpool]|uniref:MYND finger domain-containing protein n=1 Tax=Neospora caninum (strain Liverpool) TaxID=572307 RepID=F0VDE8_NEOCL|nr:conserved hypothetical protein [Neospora caninum Liverpool]CBZ51663.1 conserved hypothetical protein [Neospora caninum Liverpool]CEL65617.1 TPA: MYND finger domain-containing protein [Neospora caninum Liverpool]|eukprot:XP_003881696.1 conserved hypothetical protein [Neospora caninum Liverpool]
MDSPSPGASSRRTASHRTDAEGSRGSSSHRGASRARAPSRSDSPASSRLLPPPSSARSRETSRNASDPSATHGAPSHRSDAPLRVSVSPSSEHPSSRSLAKPGSAKGGAGRRRDSAERERRRFSSDSLPTIRTHLADDESDRRGSGRQALAGGAGMTSRGSDQRAARRLGASPATADSRSRTHEESGREGAEPGASRKEMHVGGKLYWPRATITYGRGGPWLFSRDPDSPGGEEPSRRSRAGDAREAVEDGNLERRSSVRDRLKEMEELIEKALPQPELTAADWAAAKKKKSLKHEHLIKREVGKPAEDIHFTKRGDSFHKPAVVLPGESATDQMRIPWIASSARTGLLAKQDASTDGPRTKQPSDSAPTVFDKTLQEMPEEPLSRMDNAPLESTLLERGAWDAYMERTHRTYETKQERGTKEFSSMLLENRHRQSKAQAGSRSETDEDEKAVMRRDAEQDAKLTSSPYVPLPYSQKQEEWDITSLGRISTVAEKVSHRLHDALPFEGISWSRQPTLTDRNVDLFFRLDSEDTCEQFRVTDEIRSSHERVRFAAKVVRHLMKEPESDKRTRWMNLRRVAKLYAGAPVCSTESPSGSDELEIKLLRSRDWRRSFECRDEDEDATTTVAGTPPPPIDSPRLPHPYCHREWGPKRPKGAEPKLNISKERDYLWELERVLETINETLGPPWRQKLPKAGLLATLLRHPMPVPLRERLGRSGAELIGRLHRGRFWAELFHSIWFSLTVERFQLFYTNYTGATFLDWDPATSAFDWVYYTRNLPRMFRLSNYLMTGALESHIPGLQRLLFRLNSLNFFAYRVSWSLHYSFYGNKLFSQPDRSAYLAKDGKTLDPVSMATLAFTLLRCLLKHSTACTALQYNIEAVGRLWPFVLEYKTNFITKEELCVRMFTCPLTNGFFSVLANGEVPEMPQAVHAIHSYFLLLTEFLYGGRPQGFFESLSKSFDTCVPCIWMHLAAALNSACVMNVFLVGDILAFITDLLYLTCLDGAALPQRAARLIHKRIASKLLHLLGENRPDLADSETWDHVERNAKCLRKALFTAMRGQAIEPELLEPFTLPVRSAPGTDPNVYKLPWPSLARLFPSPDQIPCWRPGCTKNLRLAPEQVKQPGAENFRYCPKCNIAAYCSQVCQDRHWVLEHRQVCAYFRRPPTFLRFHMLPGQVPMELQVPVFDIFKGMFDFEWVDDGSAFEAIF